MIELEELEWHDCKKRLPDYDMSGMMLPVSSVVMLIVDHYSGWRSIVAAVYDGKQRKWLDPYFHDVHEFCTENDSTPLMWAEMPRIKQFNDK